MDMLSRDQADRIASAIRVVRPEWDAGEIWQVLCHDDIKLRRTYADTFHAFLGIALDETTNHPNRLLSAGPWWAIRAAAQPVSHARSIDFGADCAECLKPREHLWHGQTGTVNDHEFAPRRDNPPTPRGGNDADQ